MCKKCNVLKLNRLFKQVEEVEQKKITDSPPLTDEVVHLVPTESESVNNLPPLDPHSIAAALLK